jgi:hypothetical protein
MAGDGLEVAHRQSRHQGLKGLLHRGVLLARVTVETGGFDAVALLDDGVDEPGVAITEVGPDGVQARVGQRLKQRVAAVLGAQPAAEAPGRGLGGRDSEEGAVPGPGAGAAPTTPAGVAKGGGAGVGVEGWLSAGAGPGDSTATTPEARGRATAGGAGTTGGPIS